MAQKAGRRPVPAGRPLRDGPVQPGRLRVDGGRVPRRPDQGRARPDAPGPSRLGLAEHRGRRPDPAAGAGRVLARRRPVAGRAAGRRVARCRPPTSDPHPRRRPPRRSSRRPRRPSPATYAPWRSRPCASSPRTSASTSPTADRLRPVGLDHPRRRPGCGVRRRAGGPRRRRRVPRPLRRRRPASARPASRSRACAR